MEQYYEALKACYYRYEKMCEDALGMDPNDMKTKLVSDPDIANLLRFIRDEFWFGIIDKKPLCKVNRWLGYIQGVLISRGFTDVDTERNWTRPLFRPLDFPEETHSEFREAMTRVAETNDEFLNTDWLYWR